MSSSARKIPTSEWERNKDLIVELYRSRPLKDVRVEMQTQHGFEASLREYEVQLKRWNIRKNATRKEWQQDFAANKDRPIATLPAPDDTGSIFPSVILNKSTASKKRASRWASGTRTSSIAPQASRSTLLGNQPRLLPRLAPNDPHRPESSMEAGVPDVALNSTTGSSSAEFRISTLSMDRSVSGIWPSYDVETLPGPSQALFPNANQLAPTMDLIPTPLHAYSPTLAMVQDALSPFLGQNPPGRAVFTSLGIPAENNMVFFSMLKDIIVNNELPSTQLEHNLRSRGIVLDQQSAPAMLGGFATRIVAGILSSNNQSMTRQSAHLHRILRKLGSQIPGEASALITDDQAFETKFARVLVFSMLNGFAGLNDVPVENILRFLNRFIVNRLLLEILNQCPRHVTRTLTDNIFRAAIEAKDAKVLALLLVPKLVDVNQTVCVHNGQKYTPIERAAVLECPNVVKLLIDAGADVKGSPAALINDLHNHLFPFRRTISPETYETLNILFSAGARVHLEAIPNRMSGALHLDFLIFQNIDPESHHYFFWEDINGGIALVHIVAEEFDDCRATKSIQRAIDLCHQSKCNTCLAKSSRPLRDAAAIAARTGKLETVKLLLKNFDLKAALSAIFMSAIESGSRDMIEFVLTLGPELDPPALRQRQDDRLDHFSTPIAEALRCGNMRLVRELEQSGCLDHVREGNRFGALIQAAAEAGIVTYMRDLLTRAVTSKHAHRVSGVSLLLALRGGHQDIVRMLLKAGVTVRTESAGLMPRGECIQIALAQRDVEILHDLIASGARTGQLTGLQVQVDGSTIVEMAHEYPQLELAGDALKTLLPWFMTENTQELFKDLLQHFLLDRSSLEYCLKAAFEMGRVDMAEYFLDIGASPFHDLVLKYAISDRPDMLPLLFQKERCRQTVPKCIGAKLLESVIGHGTGNAEALDELISTGAVNFTRLEYPDRRGLQIRSHYDYYNCMFTPLGMAIHGVPDRFESNLAAMRKFLDAGADPNGISKCHEYWTQGSPLMTGLMVAIETGLEEAVNMLLDYGADINARPRIRTTRTALQYAAELGDTDMVHLLISRGADVNSTAPSHGGATALQFAAMSGNCNLVASLLDHGAKLGALPSRIDGMWPLEGAAANGRLDMIRYLWKLNVQAVAVGEFPDGFSERQCLRAMNFACEKGHIGCRDLISKLSGIAVQRLETDEYGAPWIAY